MESSAPQQRASRARSPGSGEGQQEQETRVLLPGQRLLHPAQLTGAEPAFALTVHKSQGSQYSEVALLLPPVRHQDPRLAYTGLTRARHNVLLITPED